MRREKNEREKSNVIFGRDPESGVFSDPDAAYVLAFAVIMLNTDAHNPMMDTHMTRDDFIAMATSTEVGGGAS